MGMIIGIIFVLLLFVGSLAKYAAWMHLFAFVGVILLTLFVTFISHTIRCLVAKRPPLTKEQKAKLVEAKANDEQAKIDNAKDRKEAKHKWEQDTLDTLRKHEASLTKLRAELADNVKKLKKNIDILDKMDTLGDGEKNLQTVDLLIYFIKTRRADSIKEALHEYDKLVANQQMMEIELQKVQVEREKIASEHSDRMKQLQQEKDFQSRMEQQARWEAMDRQKLSGQLATLTDMVERAERKRKEDEWFNS